MLILMFTLGIILIYMNSISSKKYISQDVKKINLLSFFIPLLAYRITGDTLDFIGVFLFFELIFIEGIIDAYTTYIVDWFIYLFYALMTILYVIKGVPLGTHFMGGFIAGGFYFIVFLVASWYYKKEVFGFGDVIFMSAVGFFLGGRNAVMASMLPFYLSIIYIACVFLATKTKMKGMIPFGPFISLSGLTMVLVGNLLIELYLQLIR